MRTIGTRRNFLGGLAILLALSAPATAQQADTVETMSFTLKEAQDYAVENNTQSANAKLDEIIARKQALEVITEGLPQINATGKYQNSFELPVSVIPPGTFPGQTEALEVEFGTQHNVNLDLRATQLIIDGRYFVGLKANKSFVSISKEQRALTEVELKQQVATAYYAVLVTRENKGIIEKNIKTIDNLLYETGAMYENGFVEELDVDRLGLSKANLESKLRGIDLQEEITVNMLKYQMGVDLNTEIILTDKLEELMVADAGGVDADFDYTGRIEYRLLQNEVAIRKFDASQIRAGYFPALSAFAGYGFNAQRTEFDFFDSSEPWFRNGYFGLQLEIPIFDSYKKGAAFQQRKLATQKARNNLANFEQQANLQVVIARNNYTNAVDEYTFQKDNLALAEKIYNKVKIMYQEGVGSSLELANAESSLTETQGNYINALYDLLVKKTELDKALGKY